MKTSLSLDDVAADTARRHATAAGVELSAWVERAIRELAAAEDLGVYERWRQSWSEEDKAIEAALEAVDRGARP